MFDKAQLRGKSLPASMLLDCKYRYFLAKIQKKAQAPCRTYYILSDIIYRNFNYFTSF